MKSDFQVLKYVTCFYGQREYQNKRRRPSWACRGSPNPLCTVPSKLKSRLVVSGCLGLDLLVRLKASTMACRVKRSLSLKFLSARKSKAKKVLSFHNVLRLTMYPLASTRLATGMGCGEWELMSGENSMPQGACQRPNALKRWRSMRSEKP